MLVGKKNIFQKVLICDYCEKPIVKKDKEEVMFCHHKVGVTNYLNRYKYMWQGVQFNKRKSKHIHIKCFEKLWKNTIKN